MEEAEQKLNELREGLKDMAKNNGIDRHAKLLVSWGYDNDSYVELHQKASLSYEAGYFPLDMKAIFTLAEAHTASVLEQMREQYAAF